MSKKVSLFNWSGGKDSTLALHYILQNENFDLRYLLTTVNETYNRVSMHGVEAVFPLWKRDTTAILNEFISLGYKTIVVCAKEGLEDFCGRVIDNNFIADLPPGIDPCGENGEFHTFVFDGPIFKNPIDFTVGEKIFKIFPSPSGDTKKPAGYWYIDLIQ